MSRLWFLWLCMIILAQPQETLLIDDFETARTWEPLALEGCTIKIILDPADAQQGDNSLRMETDFAASCTETSCFAAISRSAPDLTGYSFLRLWVKAEAVKDAAWGVYVKSTDSDEYFYSELLEKSGWHLTTISSSQFQSESPQAGALQLKEVSTFTLFVMSHAPGKIRINFDELVGLADTNENGIPDVDESAVTEKAADTETMAERYFNQKDYEKAEEYYKEAASLYQQTGNKEKAQEMEEKARESRTLQDFEDAEEFYDQKDYVNAIKAYEEAKRGFVILGDLEMVDQVEERLEELSRLTNSTVSPEPQPSTDLADPVQDRRGGGIGGLLLVLFLVLLVGAGVYRWKFKNEKVEEEESERKQKYAPDKTVRVQEGKTESPLCPVCKNEVEKDWVSCPYCGTQLHDDTRVY